MRTRKPETRLRLRLVPPRVLFVMDLLGRPAFIQSDEFISQCLIDTEVPGA